MHFYIFEGTTFFNAYEEKNSKIGTCMKIVRYINDEILEKHCNVGNRIELREKINIHMANNELYVIPAQFDKLVIQLEKVRIAEIDIWGKIAHVSVNSGLEQGLFQEILEKLQNKQYEIKQSDH